MPRPTIENLVEILLLSAVNDGLVERDDMVLARNRLLEFLRLDAPDENAAGADASFSVAVISKGGEDSGVTYTSGVVSEIYARAAERGMAGDEEAFSARLMGLLTPAQSAVNVAFGAKYRSSPKEATDWFYNFSKSTDYIRTGRIAKNLYWRSPTEYGDMEITVNLSKPEKDPRQIAAAKSAPQTGYPRCLLCAENVGFAGGPHHPARQNHRTVPLTLNRARWFLQYSPYVYYNEHCIVLNAKHTPMKISGGTFSALMEFLGKFPHYFIGSNADLPIVGGSILTHDHFQGGRHVFPMELAPIERAFRSPNFPAVSAGTVKWPMSAVRLTGADPEAVAGLAQTVYERWKKYTDERAGVKAFSTDGKGRYEYHSTVTPIARMRGGLYELDIVLRNNRASEEHPLGIFHPHADVHHIKKENIGLIEVMGLAILPGRLQGELNAIARILAGEASYGGIGESEGLEKHARWIAELTEKYSGESLSQEEAAEILRCEVGQKFARVLSDCAVFKRDEAGKRQFERFLGECGMEGV